MTAERTTTTTQRLADWAEARFEESVGFAVGSDRLYGVTVLDAMDLDHCSATGARLSYLGSTGDVGGFLGARFVLELSNFDAAVLLAIRWLASDDPPARPRSYGGRRRARVVLVCDAGGAAATVRFVHRPDHPEHRAPGGTEAVVLHAVWRAARR